VINDTLPREKYWSHWFFSARFIIASEEDKSRERHRGLGIFGAVTVR
jgi:hypothetical protein